MTRRNIELMLLLIASPIVIVLFAMMVVTGGQELSFNTLGVPLGIFAAFLVAHIAVRLLAPAADPAILPIAFALSGVGIAFVTRIVPDLAVNQLLWLFMGIAAMIAALAVVRNLDKLANYKYTLMIVGILLLLSPMLPVIGQEIDGSQHLAALRQLLLPARRAGEDPHRAVHGRLPGRRTARCSRCSRGGRARLRLPDIRTLLPLCSCGRWPWSSSSFEKDLGSALVLFFRVPDHALRGHGEEALPGGGLGLAAVAAVGLYGMFGHVQARVAIWLDPFADAQDAGYQLVQSLYSIADGDLFGVGIGRAWAAAEPTASPSSRATSSSPASPRRRAFSARPVCCCCTCASPSAALSRRPGRNPTSARSPPWA